MSLITAIKQELRIYNANISPNSKAGAISRITNALVLEEQTNHIHALDAYMINNAIECIRLEFPYQMYIDWLESFTCTEQPDLKINRLDEDTYNKLATLNPSEQ